MSDDSKLAIIVHQNDEVTLRDERGVPVLCRDCRFAGWLSEWEFQTEKDPATCLLYSGGADVLDGDRVIFDKVKKYNVGEIYDHSAKGYIPRDGGHDYLLHRGWRKKYPLCFEKNQDGQCKDFVRAVPLATVWWKPWTWGSQWRDRLRRKMRL